jgi:integrase
MRVELTDAFLRALRPPQRGRIELRDSMVPGLAIRVTASGTASWSVHTRTRDGKRTRPSIGHWPTIGIKAARQHARVLLGEIARGGDPVAEKQAARAEREERLGLPTVASCLTLWREAKAPQWSPRYAAEIHRLCSKFVEPSLGKRLLRETTRRDWTGLIAAHRAKRPATATWLYQLASAFLGYAEAHGWIETFPLPRKGLTLIAPKAAPRQRVLDDEEMRRVWEASGLLAAKPRCFLRLLVLTGCRVSEAAGIAMGELDLAARRWTIPASRAKNRRAITLPLHPLLLDELASVVPDPPPSADYRLLGRTKGSWLSGISGIKEALDKLSGVTSWTMHDLRRTCRTGMARLGVLTAHAESALNHVSGRTALERTYDVHHYAPEMIAAIERWQAHVAFLVGETPGADIVPLRKRA